MEAKYKKVLIKISGEALAQGMKEDEKNIYNFDVLEDICSQIKKCVSMGVQVAIVVGGSMFGIAGMLIGVPTFAVIYTLMRSYLDRKHKEKLEEVKNENEI